MPGHAVALHLAQRGDGFLQRDAGIGPVDQQQIDAIELEIFQAVMGRAFEVAGAQVARPDLGGDEDLVTFDARRAQALAHRLLVAVHGGSVDVAIAETERLLDRARASLAAQVPGAEPDQRNAGAVDVNRLHVMCFRTTQGTECRAA
jgi:hypothetical protein